MADDPATLLRIRLKYLDVETFVERYASNISRGGIFLPSKTPHPQGTVLRFELCLANGTKLMKGEGEVAWVREPDPDHPGRAPGMGIKYRHIDPEGRKLLEQVLAFKQARGQRDDADVPIPQIIPAEISGPLRPSGSFPVVEVVQPGQKMLAVGSNPGVQLSAAVESEPELLFRDDDPALEDAIEHARDIARVVLNNVTDLDDELSQLGQSQATDLKKLFGK